MILRRTIPLALAAALASLGACNDLPTSLPIVPTTWILPIKADTISVAQFLPASVDTAGGLFVTSVKRDSIRQSLGQMCAACGAVNGTTDSVPAFTVTLAHADSFPSQVISITPGGFALSYRLDNNLGFDPLRPGVGQFGSIVTVLKDSTGAVIATDSVDGASDSLASGTSLTRNIPLGSNPISGLVNVVATITVPHGDPVTIDTSAAFQVTTLTDTATLAGVTVQLTSQSIQSDSLSVDWSGIGSDMQSNLQGAELRLDIQNPFTAAGSGSVSFKQGGTDVIPAKALTFAAGASTDTLSITQSEIQSLTSAGKFSILVNASVSGSGPGQSVALTPTQVATVAGHVLLSIVYGGK
ncbi:MAG TPA: hypothetical protein VFU45_00885 [Gemmatimonadales bacterium]|nr:hypothetical protein [Gemmatimonadales bacterium]